MATATSVGAYASLINSAAASKGSIHDDEAAQKLGFHSAFVPGSVVGTKALMAIPPILGDEWFQSGSYSLTFVTPVYTSDEVQESGELVSDVVQVAVRTREGRLCCSGQARSGFHIPWDPMADGRSRADEVFAEIAIGREMTGRDITVQVADQLPILDASGELSRRFREGVGSVPAQVVPERLQQIALELTRGNEFIYHGVKQPGMWAGHDLAYRSPLYVGETYRMQERVADKGISGRAAFLTYEFRLLADGGDEIAIGRHKVKWLLERT